MIDRKYGKNGPRTNGLNVGMCDFYTKSLDSVNHFFIKCDIMTK